MRLESYRRRQLVKLACDILDNLRRTLCGCRTALKAGKPLVLNVLSEFCYLLLACKVSLVHNYYLRPLGNLFRKILKLVVYLLKVIFGISALNARNVYNVNYKSASFNVP